MRVTIATSHRVGEKCKKWAKKMLPKEFEWTDNLEEADIVFSVFYREIFPEEFLKDKIAFNFHGGLFPNYKGSSTFAWAIINGEKETGITLHLINKDIDGGDFIAERRFKITEKDTADSLFKTAETVLFAMFIQWFRKLLRGQYPHKKQKEKGRIYYRKDLQKVKDLTRFVRAFTFEDKESAYYINKKGKKIYLKY